MENQINGKIKMKKIKVSTKKRKRKKATKNENSINDLRLPGSISVKNG